MTALQDQTTEIINRLKEFTGVNAVYSQPVNVGNYTLITAAEVAGGIGVGAGKGSHENGPEDEPLENIELSEEQTAELTETTEETPEAVSQLTGGEGAGGGLGGISRPVGVIIIGEDDVWVEPIIDRTRMGIAVATTVAAMGVAIIKAIAKARS